METTFSGMVTQFVRATFSGERTSFRQATFSSIHTVFQRATFSGKNAVFEGATFSGGSAVFKLATFSGENTSFMEVTFSGDAHIDFRNAQRPSLPGRTAVPAVLGPWQGDQLPSRWPPAEGGGGEGQHSGAAFADGDPSSGRFKSGHRAGLSDSRSQTLLPRPRLSDPPLQDATAPGRRSAAPQRRCDAQRVPPARRRPGLHARQAGMP